MEEVYLIAWLSTGYESIWPGAPAPQRLPDALMGQQWVFVTLEAAA